MPFIGVFSNKDPESTWSCYSSLRSRVYDKFLLAILAWEMSWRKLELLPAEMPAKITKNIEERDPSIERL